MEKKKEWKKKDVLCFIVWKCRLLCGNKALLFIYCTQSFDAVINDYKDIRRFSICFYWKILSFQQGNVRIKTHVKFIYMTKIRKERHTHIARTGSEETWQTSGTHFARITDHFVQARKQRRGGD